MPDFRLPIQTRALLARAPSPLRRALTSVGKTLGVRLAPGPVLPAPNVFPAEGPILLSGFFGDERGVARSALLTARALEAVGLEIIRHDVTTLLDGRAPTAPPTIPQTGVWLIHCNAPEAAALIRCMPKLAKANLLRIGYWAWELLTPPEGWLELAGAFHEIWVPSRHTASAFAAIGDKLWVMPHPVEPRPQRRRRGAEMTSFIAFADVRSSLSRKNPLGALQAYCEAVPEPNGRSCLTIKLSGLKPPQVVPHELARLAEPRADIRLVVDHLSEAELEALMSESDVLISLHRAEGFGLTIAEAMSQGSAVIATAWSGVDEFLPPDPRQRAPFSLVSVEDSCKLYPADGEWAEPSILKAAELIRSLIDRPQQIDELGTLNLRAIRALHNKWTASALAKHWSLGWLGSSPDKLEF